MQFHSVETGIDGHPGRSHELVDDRLDLGTRDLSAVRHRRRVDEPARRDRCDPGQYLVRHHAGMAELRRNRRAGVVYGVGERAQPGQRGLAHEDLSGGAGAFR
jgi:hypothetical protein